MMVSDCKNLIHYSFIMTLKKEFKESLGSQSCKNTHNHSNWFIFMNLIIMI